jgi:hypothetical protein
MGHHKFAGEYSGKFNQTVVQGGKITSSKGKATVTITEVGKGAYLITTVENGSTTFNDLAYLEGDVLRAQAQSGEGVTSTYFSGKHLIHQVSNKSPTTWTVKNYKLKYCKH